MKIKEYDVVRVVRLARADRTYEGTSDARRPPRIGDLATVVQVSPLADGSVTLTLECVGEDGSTLWLADFSPEEIELVERPESQR